MSIWQDKKLTLSMARLTNGKAWTLISLGRMQLKSRTWQGSCWPCDRLDVYHSLHCLVGLFNMQRRSNVNLRSEANPWSILPRVLQCLQQSSQCPPTDAYWYAPAQGKLFPSTHSNIPIDHCIDYLRQSIQCHSDLTPMNWHVSRDNLSLIQTTTHTCRDFDQIHEWATQRKTHFATKQEVISRKYHIEDWW